MGVISNNTIRMDSPMFQEGDVIQMTTDCKGCRKGSNYILLKDNNGKLRAGPGDSCSCRGYWILIKKANSQPAMSKITEVFKSLTRKEPQKSFVQAGITDSNDMLTADGQAIFLAYLLQQEGDAFKTAVVDPLITETAAAAGN